MAGRNIQGMAPQNYGQLNQSNSNKAIAQARLDSKQEALFKAISNVIQASAKDIYGDVTDKKTRYIVDLILKRIEGLFETKGISSEQIQEVVSQAVKELQTTSAGKEQLEKFGKDIADKTSKLDGIEQKLESNAQKITELKTLFGQQTTSKPQAEVGKTLKQEAFSKQTTFSKMLTTLGIDQVKNFAKLTDIVNAFHTDISSAMKASQQINVGNLTNIQEKIAAIQDSSMQVAKQVEQLQENITDAINEQQQSFLKNFEFSFKGMLIGAMKGIWTMTKFSFKIAWKLVKGPLEALVINPLKKTLAFAKYLITAPLKFLTDTVSKIFNGLTKGTFNILAGFLSTPAGMFALGYFAGWVWKNWLVPLWDNYIHPFWNKVIDFWDKYISPIIEPFKQWFDGKKSFTQALEESWNKLKQIVWTNWIQPKLNEWFKPVQDMYNNVCDQVKEHPQVAIRVARLLMKPIRWIIKIIGYLSWLWNPLKAVGFIKDIWFGKKVAETAATVASKSTQIGAKYSAKELAKHGLRLNKAGRVIDATGKFVSAKQLEKLGIKAFEKIAFKQGGKLLAKAGSKFVPGVAVAMSGFDFKDSWENFKKGNYKSAAAFFTAGITGAAGGIAGLTGVGYPIQVALAAASTAASIAGAAGEIVEETKQSNKLLGEQQDQVQQLTAELAKGANINLEPNIEDLNIGQNQENYIEKYLSELSDIKDTTSSRDVQIMSMLEQIITMLQAHKSPANNYLFMPSLQENQTRVGVR